MRILRTTPLLAFAVCLAAGFWAGLYFHLPPAAVVHVPNPTIPALPSGQRRFLLVYVQDVQAEETQIQAVLLFSYSPLYPYLMPLPIYPSPANVDAQSTPPFTTRLHNTPGGLDPQLVTALHNKNYAWDGYIVFDDNALAQVINLLGGIAINGQNLTAEDILQQLQQAAANPREAAHFQAALLDSLCQQASSYHRQRPASAPAENLNTYTRSDLDLKLVASEWLTLLSPGGKHTCSLAAYQTP
jgi:hypothetical protein